MTEDTNEDKFASPITADPALVALIRDQVMAELEAKDDRERVKREQARKEEAKAHQDYIQKMYESKDPWVEVIGIEEDAEHGLKLQLEWNDAFIAHLRDNGITGLDEDQMVQHWVALMSSSVAEQMSDSTPQESDFE